MLTNTSERSLPVQSRLFAWSQADGEDVYAPSSDLIISPSIASIPPGETQIVRVLRNEWEMAFVESGRRARAEAALRRIAAQPTLSRDVNDIASRALSSD